MNARLELIRSRLRRMARSLLDRPGLLEAVLLAAVVLLQVASLFSERTQYHDNEELYNGTVGLELLHGHLTQLFNLQYRHFCGGCSVAALSAAALYAFLPPVLFVYKLVPIGFYAGMFLLGYRLLRRYAGRGAALAFGALWILPPYTWSRLALVSYGNHYESNLYVLIALSLAVPIALAHRSGQPVAGWRYFALGLALGFGVYTCFSAAYAIPALLLLTALPPPRRWQWPILTALGGVLGASPWALYWKLVGTNPVTSPIYHADEWTLGLQYVPGKLRSLITPRQLEGILGYPMVPSGRVTAWLSAVALVVAIALVSGAAVRALARRRPRAREEQVEPALPPEEALEPTPPLPPTESRAVTALAFALLLASFLCVFLGTRYFNIEFPEDTLVSPSPMGLRYLAPLYVQLLLILALATQRLLERPRHGTRLALLLLLGPLAAGAVGRLGTFTAAPLSTAVFYTLGADYRFFRPQAGWQLSETDHEACSSQDPRSMAFHQWTRGWRDAAAAWRIDPDGSSALPQYASPRELRIERLGKLRPPSAGYADRYYEGVALVLHDNLIRPERPVGDNLEEVAGYCRDLPREAWDLIAREVQHLPDWVDQAVNRDERVEAYVRQVIAPLATRASPHPLEPAAAWGLGYVKGKQHLIRSAEPPDRLFGMVKLTLLRMVGMRWEEGELSRPQLPPVPAGLSGDALRAYLEGFGTGLGEKWGTRLRSPLPPEGTPLEFVDAFHAAYRAGETEYVVR